MKFIQPFCLTLTLLASTLAMVRDTAPTVFAVPVETSIPEHVPGGFVLYQPFDDTDSMVADGTYTHNQKSYSQSIVRWVAVGFLHVEEDKDDSDQLNEHWFLSKGDKNSTATSPYIPFVEQYFWPGRVSPTDEKHAYWNNLPVRFERRNDLSGAADLDEFVSEVSTTYGYSVSAAAGDFSRYNAAAKKDSAY